MDDYVLYISGKDFPPDAQSSLTGKRKTARLCHVEHEEEESYQVTWSLRSAPTIQYIPRRMLSYAVKSMLETAGDACPIQIFFILEDLYTDNWFIELVAFLVQATSVDFIRPVIVHLVQGQQSIQDNIDTSELETMLNAATKMELFRAIPAPWCWYGDLSIPGYESSLFTIVLQSEDPVIGDLYASIKQRNKINFIDILNGGEKSDLTLDQLRDKPMNVLLPGHVIQCMRKLLNGGIMLVRLPGNFSSSNYALYETNQKQWVMTKVSKPSKQEIVPKDDLMEVMKPFVLPEITAADLRDEMFTNPEFDFSKLILRTSPEFGILPHFSPVDVSRALSMLKKAPTTPDGDQKRIRIGSDISFFSPNKIILNKIKIEENLDEARSVRSCKLDRSNRKPTMASPIRTGLSRSLCSINREIMNKRNNIINGNVKESSPVKRIMNRNFEKQAEILTERLNETASLASQKPQKPKLTRLNSLIGASRRSLASRRSNIAADTRTQTKRSATDTLLKQTKLTDRRNSIAVTKSELSTKARNERRPLYKRSMSSVSQQSNISYTSTISVPNSDRSDLSDRSALVFPCTPKVGKLDPKRKMTGSEKKAKLLKIVRFELEKQGMTTSNKNYKKCIKKLHEMCRMMLKGVTTADKLIPLMEKAATANALLVISSINSEE